jgi:uncharacterized membrane protein
VREGNSVALRSGALLLVTAGATVSFAADWQSPGRVIIGLGFMLFVPGLAIAEMLGVSETLHRLAIATGASLAVETIVAVAMLYAGVFTVARAFAIVVGLTSIAVLVALVRAYRSAR